MVSGGRAGTFFPKKESNTDSENTKKRKAGGEKIVFPFYQCSFFPRLVFGGRIWGTDDCPPITDFFLFFRVEEESDRGDDSLLAREKKKKR